MHLLKALFLFLLIAHRTIGGEITEITEKADEYSSDYDDMCDFEVFTDLSRTIQKSAPSRVDNLRPINDVLGNLLELPALESAIFLNCIYDIVTNLTTRLSLVSEEEENSTSEFLQKTAEIINHVYTNNTFEVDDLNILHLGLVKMLISAELYLQMFPWASVGFVNCLGSYVYNDSEIRVGQSCLVTKETLTALVVFPADSSPLRPPPITGVRVVSFQIVHLILDRMSSNYSQSCPNDDFFRMIVMVKIASKITRFLRYGCAQWSAVDRDWSTENCIPMKEFEVDNKGRCNCDTTLNGETTEYVVYEYVEDVEEFIEFKTLKLGVTNSSDVTEMNSYLSRLSEIRSSNSPQSIDSLVSDVLFKTLQFDLSLLVNNCSTTVLSDIGGIMEAVKPNGAIGRGNQLLKSFLCDVNEYKGDPLIAFAFYNSTTYALDMEYFRSKEQVDFNRLFFGKMEYSLLFSESVILQNIRYGYILYPLNKFFKSITVIDRTKVIASRVLEVFLTPNVSSSEKQDQLVHMFFNPDPQAVFEYGCAYWNEVIGQWTTDGCYQNPDLYREVCTCNMSAHFRESQTRGVFVSIKFVPPIDVFKNTQQSVKVDFDYLIVSYALFNLRNIDRFYQGEESGLIALKFLNDYYRNCYTLGAQLDSPTQIELVQRASWALSGGENFEKLKEKMQLLLRDDSCLWFRAFVGSMDTGDSPVTNDTITCTGDLKLLRNMKDNVSLTLNIAQSLMQNNIKYAVLLYPVNFNIRSLPSIGQRIIRSYAFDVNLEPSNVGDNTVEQYVEVAINQTDFNVSMGCSYWREDLEAWTQDGCRIVQVGSTKICYFSISSNMIYSRSYGQYIAYHSLRDIFDKTLYDELILKPIDIGSDQDFNTSRDLIHSLKNIPFEDSSVFRVLHIYLRLLGLGKSILLLRKDEVRYILQDMEFLISHYHLSNKIYLTLQLSIQGTQGLNLKSAAVAADLFSNAVLYATDASNSSKTADLSVVVLGFYMNLEKEKAMHGFYLVGELTEQLFFMSSSFSDAALLPSTSLSCFVTPTVLIRRRLVIVIYPINTSPYPLTMTTQAIFNTRQLDVFIANDESMYDNTNVNYSITSHFRPTIEANYYVNISCASWDDTETRWGFDICTLASKNSTSTITFIACVCNLTDRPVTRIILYEYTDLENFSFIVTFEGTTIVFLIVALLSALGLCVLALTAFLFPKWREELGNKIMINLTAATSLYLTISIYRETHLIYAATNYSNSDIIVFTAFVHYSRLAHYCWGLVMSVLQYKRFSGVVGASTISHLLLKVSLFAWGAPLVPLAILLSWDTKVHFCSPDKLTHYVLYLVPVVVITMLNIGLLVAIVITITNCFGFWDDEELQRHGFDNKEVMLRRIKQIVLMFFLFGIPAVFEMLNDFGDHIIALEYINKILDPIQGFVMFLFFVVIDDKTKGYWYTWYYGEQAVAPVIKSTRKVPIKLQIPRAKAIRRVVRPAVEKLPLEEAKLEEFDLEEKKSKEFEVKETKTEEIELEEIKTKEIEVKENKSEEIDLKEIKTKVNNTEDKMRM